MVYTPCKVVFVEYTTYQSGVRRIQELIFFNNLATCLGHWYTPLSRLCLWNTPHTRLANSKFNSLTTYSDQWGYISLRIMNKHESKINAKLFLIFDLVNQLGKKDLIAGDITVSIKW